jgi:hypothetical protein
MRTNLNKIAIVICLALGCILIGRLGIASDPQRIHISHPVWTGHYDINLYKIAIDSLHISYEADFYINLRKALTVPINSRHIEFPSFDVLDSYMRRGDSTAETSLLMDINNDGNQEVAMVSYDDSVAIPANLRIYTFNPANSTVELTGNFDGIKSHYGDFRFLDLDNDTTNELTASSVYYDEWQIIRPVLIWKCENGKYRLANGKLFGPAIKKYLCMNDTSLTAIYDWLHHLQFGNFWPDSVQTYPQDLIINMLFMAYSGRPEYADSLLYMIWPEANRGRYQFHKFFWTKVKSDPMYEELLKSNW